MTDLTPAEVTAQAEPVANTQSGTFGGVCQTCTAPRQVKFFYDDPLTTPVTDLTTRFLDADETVLAQTRTYHPLNYGAKDTEAQIQEIRDNLGIAEQPDLPHAPLTIDTGAEADIDSAADDAWELEKGLVGDLWTFETAMVRTFQPYVDEWNRDGWTGAAGDFINGVGRGISSWWNGEKDFWGSAWGWLKSTTSSAASAAWDAVTSPIETAQALGRAAWDGAQAAYEQLENLVEILRALLTGDIDAFFEKTQLLAALRTAGGAIGEFGQMIYDAFQNGVEWLNSLIEMIRRTPVLGLIANTAMRVITMMTPNFWAEMVGTGGGFVIPEVIIWLICLLIGALAAASGAGAAPAVAALAARAASTAAKIRRLIKGSGNAFRAITRFLDLLQPIIAKIGPLGRKLRDSIREIQRGVVDKTQKLFMPTRYYLQRLRQLEFDVPGAHGPQRHEGDVTAKALGDRTYYGIDPMTGTKVDGVHGGNHMAPRNSTKFKTPADYVRADDFMRNTADFKAGVSSGDSSIEVIESISNPKLFGPSAQSRFMGKQRVGSAKNPTGMRDLDFRNGTIKAVYKKKPDGTYGLYTMFPQHSGVFPAVYPWK
ncbi:hypothetical protein [Tritonibacter mobilis]|uniref:Bacterial EndoU nuclease domain-containing protein n=1 Tax=Tritonibacter mobilis F1926 TaxID=1265309 RepID=A0A1B1A7Q6_9RHOB|nr:hypothetical protein [Tritonibacter mobilis]ANP42558.1 hypothetical protein K529_017455 [Tritonibacter mobilis F1926]KJZ21962.1 hypothetical protein TW79_20600 [Tritonibacter mobilis]